MLIFSYCGILWMIEKNSRQYRQLILQTEEEGLGISGIGIDLIEIDRITAAVAKEAFVKRVFTPAEREYCESRRAGRYASYAARFAGKEAVVKALGTGMRQGSWLDIEILPDSLGAPQVSLTGKLAEVAESKAIRQIYISLTHARLYAAAQVICWGGNQCESGDNAGNAGDRPENH